VTTDYAPTCKAPRGKGPRTKRQAYKERRRVAHEIRSEKRREQAREDDRALKARVG